MAERKSVNKYYPPDWDPSKGSVNKYVGQHPLRDRAKKLSQGILIIRFEMPYNIWCGGCGSHIGMGVRYNAEKSKTGNYYTTPIYKFRMKCHLCDNHFEIQTDPKNHDYVILSGARRKEQRWDPKENEQIQTEDKATQKKMATDPMFKLEHGSDDQKKGRAAVTSIASLEEGRDGWRDDYILNKIARQQFRAEKKSIKTADDLDKALLAKSSLDIQLVDESDQDVRLAGLMKYRTVETFDEKRAQKRKEIEDRPLFQANKRNKTDSSDSNNKNIDIIKKNLQAKSSICNPFSKGRSPSSTINKSILGIRRKSVPSPTNDKATIFTSKLQNEDNAGFTSPLSPETIVIAGDDEDIESHNEVGSTAIGTVEVCSLKSETMTNVIDSQVMKETGEYLEETIASEREPVDDNNDMKLIVTDIHDKMEPDYSSITGKEALITTATATDCMENGSLTIPESSEELLLFKKNTSSTIDVKQTPTNDIALKQGLSLISVYGDSDTDSNS